MEAKPVEAKSASASPPLPSPCSGVHQLTRASSTPLPGSPRLQASPSQQVLLGVTLVTAGFLAQRL